LVFFFFELLLIPILILVYGWGYQPERFQAIKYLLVYAFFSRFPLFLGFFFFFTTTGSCRFYLLFQLREIRLSKLRILIIMVSILVKIPIYGLHHWLPKVHVEASVKSRIVLAGVFLKLGGFGLLRMVSLCQQSLRISLLTWCMLGSLVTRLICLTQNDYKKLIAYASVRHITITIPAILIIGNCGTVGRILIFFAHAFSSRGLFWVRGSVIANLKSRNIFFTKSMINNDIVIILFMILFCLANFSIPPFINLLAELIIGWELLKCETVVIFVFLITGFVSCLYRIYLLYKILFSRNGYSILYSRKSNVITIIMRVILVLPILRTVFFFNFFLVEF